MITTTGADVLRDAFAASCKPLHRIRDGVSDEEAQLGGQASPVRFEWRDCVRDSGRLVLIGYWKGYGQSDWPDPRDFVDASWDAYERHEVAKYLSNGTVVAEYRGLSSCRFCGHGTGHREFTATAPSPGSPELAYAGRKSATG